MANLSAAHFADDQRRESLSAVSLCADQIHVQEDRAGGTDIHVRSLSHSQSLDPGMV